MKTDARIKYTKMIVKDCFLKLLAKMPLEKITVKRLCETAEINRTTFYKYYMDIYDLMQQIEEETLDTLLGLIEASNSKSIEDILVILLQHIEKKEEYYRILFYKQDTHSFHEKLLLLCFQMKQPDIQHALRLSSLKEQEWFYYYLVQGSAGILDCWVKEGKKEKPAVVAGFISKMYHNSLQRGN